MIKRISILICIVLLWGVWNFDGNRVTAREALREQPYGTWHDSALGRSASHNCNHQLALQQSHPTETPEQWVELGQRIHGGFGSYIALGIRIGGDARQRLEATSRSLDITYYSGAIAPCPCVVDGIMIATVSTPGQNLLRVAATTSPDGTFGVAEIRAQKAGKTLRYIIPATAKAQLDAWNHNTTERQRYDAVMNASQETLFSVEVIR